MGKGSKEQNEAIVARLRESQEEIERVFGNSLSWELVENWDVSRIRYTLKNGGYRDDDKWPAIQDNMIDAMIRLEAALQPHLEKLDV